MTDATKMAGQLLFQNTLAEVVRKLRSSNESEAEVIEQCIADIKSEVTSTVQSVKVTAVLKAVYFSMLGYSATYAAFNIIEVMADKMFGYKRIGYMAACLTFTPKTEVLPLLTALLKRDLSSANQYEVGFALYCISTVSSPDLARDLVVDVVNLLSHPRNYVRKKAVLSLYRIFFEYPESLRPTYPRLKEKLDSSSERCDNDPAVRGALVCVLCELARRNPASFLGLAVPFFSMLSTIQSNWTLIKIIKVFGYFAPLEPRLGKKLVDPIIRIVQTTGAKSVRYECILAVANGMSKTPSLTKIVAEELRVFVEDSDQNLKYLGLDAMSRMVRDNAKLLSGHRDVVLACLDDIDTTIRRKALEVLSGLVTKRNFVSTINNMMHRCVRLPPDEEWSNRVLATVIEVAQTDDYSYVQDFEWYVKILLDISLVNLSTYQHGALVQKELVTVLTRVNAVRQFGVNELSQLLSNTNLLKSDPSRSSQWEVLKAAAFLCGEYPYWLQDKRRTCELLLSERISLLKPEVQVVCVTAVGKIVAYMRKPCQRHLVLVNGEEEIPLPEDSLTFKELRASILQTEAITDSNGTAKVVGATGSISNRHDAERKNLLGLQLFRHSVHPDVQERASMILYQLNVDPDIGPLLYEQELLPVAIGAQEAVEPPEGLNLDEPFCSHLPAGLSPSDSEEDGGENDEDLYYVDGYDAIVAREQRRREEARRGEVAPFYIKNDALSRDQLSEELHSAVSAAPAPKTSTSFYVPQKSQVINRYLSRPKNYDAAAHGQRRIQDEDVDEATKKFRNVDVTRSLAPDERLPEPIPYGRLQQSATTEGTAAAAAAAAALDFMVDESFDPLVLLEEKYLRVTAFVLSCRVRKAGTQITMAVEISNLASSSSMRNVSLRFQPNKDNYTTERVRLEADKSQEAITGANRPKTGRGDNKNAVGEGGDGDKEVEESDRSIFVSKCMKGTTTLRTKMLLTFSGSLPPSLTEPLLFSLLYTREKKPTESLLPMPLSYRYFAKPHVDTTSVEFMQTIMARHLSESPVLTCFVAVAASCVPLVLPAIQQQLRLRPVDILKDAASFYSVLQSRKSAANHAHVAVLLLEDEVEGEKGISIAVKSEHTSLAELLAQEIAKLLMTATS
ncbi:adaptor complex protein (AP) 3 delta subunit 1,putative [Trypanosoma brucei gambiense DAL972]|uniref:AP-3 complex subunit delta n=1 Tax=Trypanosoma brucei gambiense (strain MHOM/CI/86/DAL972) TaxID=679716 RepID=C9ZPN6_TRYB9|nr:adaptor complex protein (AP) 3 delta subunit 1,putative [Trypanosoma brucei gambiense DAL972]CBH11364.1 adaptor complex protein (AP) 3 delta subunit 1,putative [Trypanosoma brucei gambiense DAL972]|eukprot:XP_011773651.1 adaptor complex protein (AP) 3 delta subunit 1,putative [Trypanosoma brucei gambiense DAL972]